MCLALVINIRGLTLPTARLGIGLSLLLPFSMVLGCPHPSMAYDPDNVVDL